MPAPAAAVASYRAILQPSGLNTGQPSGLEQRLARAPLRRVEAKEFVFAEGDPPLSGRDGCRGALQGSVRRSAAGARVRLPG